MSMYMNGRYFKITHPPRSFFVEGNPVTFKTKYKLPIKSLKVNFNPVQDLHGYENPWPAGGGKNLLPNTGLNNTRIGLTCSYDENESIVTINGVSDSDISYLDFASYPNTLMDPSKTYCMSVRCVGGSITVPEEATGNTYGFALFNSSNTDFLRNSIQMRTFTNGDIVYARKRGFESSRDYHFMLQCFVTGLVANNAKLKIQLEEVASTSATPSDWAPYSNICPISGWTGANVEATGKNLFDKADTSKQINAYIDGGKITSSSNRLVVFIPCKPSTAYTVSRLAVVTNERLYVAESTDFPAVGVSISNAVGAPTSQTIGNKMSLSITTSSSAKYLVVWAYWGGETTALDTLQIEKGSTATSYEPYSGSTTPISWADEAGTVYSGTLGWEKDGTVKLTKTMQGVTLSGNEANWTAYVSVPKHYQITVDGNKFNTSTEKYAISNYYTSRAGFNSTIANEGVFSVDANRIRFKDARFDTLSDFLAWVNQIYSAGTPLMCVYELATPVTYTLTSQEALTLLQGTNTIWSDTNGNLEVTYESYTNEQ